MKKKLVCLVFAACVVSSCAGSPVTVDSASGLVDTPEAEAAKSVAVSAEDTGAAVSGEVLPISAELLGASLLRPADLDSPFEFEKFGQSSLRCDSEDIHRRNRAVPNVQYIAGIYERGILAGQGFIWLPGTNTLVEQVDLFWDHCNVGGNTIVSREQSETKITGVVIERFVDLQGDQFIVGYRSTPDVLVVVSWIGPWTEDYIEDLAVQVQTAFERLEHARATGFSAADVPDVGPNNG